MVRGETTIVVVTTFSDLYMKLGGFPVVVFGAIQEGLFEPWRRITLLSNLIEKFRDLKVDLGQLNDGRIFRSLRGLICVI